ncbi:MAG: 3-oxoacyl-[acyl-carrier-protein] synthase [Candidatus Sumerlaeota bacterium]|nr:3-oxoacyl-[acyl-carrier-protein] synthase [Candidatus Sumerlaeota bacterium]
MNLPARAGILGIGASIPEKVLTNAELSRMVDTNDEWILSRTGIRERRILGEGELLADHAAESCRRALDNAGLKTSDVDLILACTYTADRQCPSLACDIHRRLGPEIGMAGALDINAACSGFLYGMHLADKLIRTGAHRHILIVAAEAQSRFVDFTDRATCILFGDGASAIVMGPVTDGSDSGVYSTCVGADGSGSEQIRMVCDSPVDPSLPQARNNGTPNLRMNGREVFKFAVRIFIQALDEALTAASITSADVDLLIPHQANLRIIEAGAARLSLPPERMIVNIDKYGNTASVTIPLGMMDLLEDGRLTKGKTLALVAFGAGYTYGSAIVKW